MAIKLAWVLDTGGDMASVRFTRKRSADEKPFQNALVLYQYASRGQLSSSVLVSYTAS